MDYNNIDQEEVLSGVVIAGNISLSCSPNFGHKTDAIASPETNLVSRLKNIFKRNSKDTKNKVEFG